MSTTTTTRANYAHPDATRILPANAPREHWLEVRNQGIGGSEVSAIAGLNRWNGAYSVWLDKMGLTEDTEPNQAMRMGVKLEPIIRELFTEDTGLTVRQRGLLRSKNHPFMQYTPDGFVGDGGVFEAKSTTGWLSSEWEDGQVPDHAELQVQHGLAVTGRTHAWVCGLLDGRDFIIRRIERDEALIRDLIDLERRFWEEHVVAGVAPPATAPDLQTLKDRHPVAEADTQVIRPADELAKLRADYEFAAAEIKKWTEHKDDAAAQMRALAGEAEKLVDDEGTVYATLKGSTLNATAFAKAHPDIAEQYQVATTKLDRKALAEDHPELVDQHKTRTLRLPKRA